MNAATSPEGTYVAHPALRRRFGRVEREFAFRALNPAEWRLWRRKTVARLKELIGYGTFRTSKLRARVTDLVDCGDYLRERVEIRTEPDVTMPLFVLRPKGERRRRPAVIAPHGHVSGGKVAVAGVRDNPEVAKTIDAHNYDYGVQFCRAGFVVFCPDARGQGERQEASARGNVLAASCGWLSQMGLPLGQAVAGMWAWDLHRLIDYIESRPDCDPARIGCGGLSGGGLQTLWAAALDPRIRCAVISGYFYGYRESLLDLSCCWCNYVPHLWETVDMGDIGALIAPRPLLVETGSRDALNGKSGLANVRSQMAIARRAYRLLGAARNLAHDVFDGEHRWHGVQAIPWMKRHLQSE